MNNIIEITDFSASELDVYARLSEGQLVNRRNPEKGMFIAESPKVIERALDAGYEPVSCLMEKRHIEGEGKPVLDRIGDVPVYCAESDILSQLTGFNLTRGMLCAMKRKPLPDVKELCADKNRIVILDKVMNPTNVGAIIRSAAALGMDAVVLTPGSSDPLYRRAARVSMGTEGDGLSDETIFDCDYTVKIPMYHGVDSLNVAAASAVAFYQLGKRQS